MGGLVSLVFFAVLGGVFDLWLRHRIEAHLYGDTQRVATGWIGGMRPGRIPPPPATHADLVQLVDSRNRVVTASPAAGLPAMTSPLPPSRDRIRYDTSRTPRGEPVVVTALRVVPMQERLLWNGEPHAVYAGRIKPPILTTHLLEVFTAFGVLAATALGAGASRRLAGWVLGPVAEIRERASQITISDLSLRLPQPPGDDEIAKLARTCNRMLDRLEASVRQQRHFASLVSHELRTPLAGLRVPPEPIDLGSLTRQEAAARTGTVPVRAEVKEAVTVVGNRTQLCGVLTNLLVNAQRHARDEIEVTVERDDGHAVISVLDDGPGIPPEDRDRIFQPFVRLADARRRDPEGTGLGLALCRATAEAHHGSLRVEDSPRGARFVLRLPLHAPPQSPDRQGTGKDQAT